MSSSANTRRFASAGLMLAHRRRRCASIKPALAKRLVIPGQPGSWWSRVHRGVTEVLRQQQVYV